MGQLIPAVHLFMFQSRGRGPAICYFAGQPRLLSKSAAKAIPLKSPSQPHLCFCLHGRFWLLHFIGSMHVETKKNHWETTKISKHTFRNTAYSKTRFCTNICNTNNFDDIENSGGWLGSFNYEFSWQKTLLGMLLLLTRKWKTAFYPFSSPDDRALFGQHQESQPLSWLDYLSMSRVFILPS